ncbi:MAG: ribulose-phosphate 3-epimerase [Candidatus Methylacidiphilales bacterium]
MQRPLIIAPSILAADYSCLGAEVKRVEASGADWVHVDVMDGHFVPNISFGMEMVWMLRRQTELPLDVHLMIERPDRYVRNFIEAGADVVTVHLEAEHNVPKTLSMIRDMGCKAGLAINPPTLVENALPLLPYVDLLLCMTVNPGFGGQTFIIEVLEKVRAARAFIRQHNLDIEIEVDGGIHADTAGPSVAAGANVLVAGSFLFKQKDMKAGVDLLRQRVAEVSSAG